MAILISESGVIRLSESGQIRVTESHLGETDWPGSLPQAFLLDSYRATWPSTTIRSQPEAGPAIVRRRISAAVTPFAGTMQMTGEQRSMLYSFYQNTALGGAIAFAFPAQDGTGGTWDCRFAAEPEESQIAHDLWRISMELEKLP